MNDLIDPNSGARYTLLEEDLQTYTVRDDDTNEELVVPREKLIVMPTCTCPAGERDTDCALHGLDGLFKQIDDRKRIANPRGRV